MSAHRIPLVLFVPVALASCGGGGTNGTGAAGASGVAGSTAGTGGSTGGQAGTVGSGGSGGAAGTVGIAGTGGSGGGGPGGTGGSGPTCPTGRQLCGAECVDTTADPRHCGNCGVACTAGQVCATSGCQAAGDCRQTPCTGFSYCDLANGQCKPGCALDSQCVANETCDIATHACLCRTGFNRCGGTCVANSSGMLGCADVCATCPTLGATAFACSGTSCVATACSSGNHLCAGSCVPNSSVATCGTSCTPCPVPANGTATCNGTTCGITCNTGTLSCGGTCAVCPTTGATTFACSGTSCVATACAASGYRLCSGVCGACPTTNVSTTTCSGTSCVAATCFTGYHACSGVCVLNSSLTSCGTTSCTPCPTVANGTATCNGVTCGTTCNTGYRLCASACAPCPSATTTTCSGSQCVAATCPSGQHVCSGMCASNSSPNSCGTSCTPCPAGPANSAPECANSTTCDFLCFNGWVRCGNACCPDCRGMSGACSGFDWCGPTTGLCRPVQKLQPDAANVTANDSFGNAVALADAIAVVGSPSDDGTVGSAYMFERQSDGNWTMQGPKLKPNTLSISTSFGNAVAIAGQRVVVGAWGQFPNGAAYVFERSGVRWGPTAAIEWMGEAASDGFGASVSVSGDRVLVGASRGDAPGVPDSGAAYVFERQTDGTWPSTGAKLLALDPQSNDQFGTSVSLSGDRALVGASFDDEAAADAGAAYIFVRQGDGTWVQEQKLMPTDGHATQLFGTSVSLVGDRALIGANLDDDLGSRAGAAYVFERQANGTWLQTGKLVGPAPNAGPGDEVGWSVSQSGDRALLGALRANLAAGTGGTTDAGVAYLFQRQANGTWDLGVTVQSDPADVIASRRFGSAVALSGNFALVGAPGDRAGPPSAGVLSGTAYVIDVRSVLP